MQKICRRGLQVRLARCMALALALPTGPALAEGWSGALVLASDKVYRGISQSNGRAALLLDLSHAWPDGWQLGAGLATPSYPTLGGKGELSLNLGREFSLNSDWSAHLGLARYGQTGSELARTLSYHEAALSLAWRGRVRASLALAPDSTGYRGHELERGRALTAELSLQQRLAGRWSVDAGLGYYELHGAAAVDYGYASLGLRWANGAWQGSLSWINSQAAQRQAAREAIAGTRWVAAAMWGF
jgi:uncharacterized protein (TIGR02001 family)